MKLENILEPVAAELDMVEERLRDWADGDLPVVSEAVGHIVRAGGKRLRPACLLLAAKLRPRDTREHQSTNQPINGVDSLTRSLSPVADAIEPATAVEIIHTASLVHDDIVDGAPVRRGTPTLHARWGQPVALLVGDLLYSQLFRQLTAKGQGEALHCVAETVHRMVLGELAETLRRDDLSLTEPDYFEIVANKTGALFSCATYLGARAGGLPEAECARLRRYGERLGAAFQIVDDLLDICEEEADLGKPAGADLREGKVTLPVIHALERDRGPGRRQISRLFSEKSRIELRAAVRRSGSLSYTVEKAEEAAGEALSCLKGLRDGPCLRSLVGMGGYVVSRGRDALARLSARAGGDAVVGGGVPAAALRTR